MWYLTIGIVIAYLLGFGWLILAGLIFGGLLLAWIDDREYEVPDWVNVLPGVEKNQYTLPDWNSIKRSDIESFFVFSFLFILVSIFVWPLAVIALLVLAARAVRRTQKVVVEYKQKLDNHVSNTEIHNTGE